MLRTTAPGHINHQFVNADPQNNVAPAEVDAVWLNGVQETLLHPIEASGQAAGASNDQITLAIRILASQMFTIKTLDVIDGPNNVIDGGTH
jgi:hypothetical protein